MKLIITGAGQVGRYAAQEFNALGYDVTLVEMNKEKAMAADEELDIRVIHADGACAQVLGELKVHKADCFLAMTPDDGTNIISCSLAKALGCKRTIARIHDRTYTDNSLFNYQLHFGIDTLIHPEALCANELAKTIRNPGRTAVEHLARGAIEVTSITLDPTSPIIGSTMQQLHITDARIGYIQRADGKMEIPNAHTVIAEDDELTLVGPPESVRELRESFLARPSKQHVTVCLFGASEVNISLMRILNSPHYRLRLLESSADHCQNIAENFPHVTVIQGDATSLRLMEEEHVGDSDFFIAGTKDDEDNIMTCLQASNLGVPHVQLVINKPDYEGLLHQIQKAMGIEAAVSPRNATIKELLSYVKPNGHRILCDFSNNQVCIVEVDISPESTILNQPLKAIKLPSKVLLIALQHKFSTKVPGADDILLAGDRVIAICPQERKSELIKLLAP